MADLPLGKEADYDAPYDPALLCPIARAPGRAELGIGAQLPFHGCDIWNAYELSWLDARGKPAVAMAELRVPADSPCIVESKSLKLYLNSLNQRRCADAAEVREIIANDVGRCVGTAVEVSVQLPGQWQRWAVQSIEGECLDTLDVAIDRYTPAPELLTADAGVQVSRRWFSRLLRSRCPVTGQPDWGTVMIEYSGAQIDPAGLLGYIVSFRQHQDFHEHCVERMFVDIGARCAPQSLTVYARYLRRGGLDINPFRSSGASRAPNPRQPRQ